MMSSYSVPVRARVCGYHYVALNFAIFGVHAAIASFHHAMNISARPVPYHRIALPSPPLGGSVLGKSLPGVPGETLAEESVYCLW